MKKVLVVWTLLLVGLFAVSQHKIHLANSVIELDKATDIETLNAQMNRLNSYSEFKYGIVQFIDIPTQEVKINLETQGIQLLSYMPDRAYLVKVKVGSQLTSKGYNLRIGLEVRP